MKIHYSSEKNVQILIALMKEHGIRKVIVSPGAENIVFVGSIQNDPFFELYSCVDERSAAYIACGLAAETGEAVALSCTAATASRNYVSGLTEAYYRKLPVLAITSSQPSSRIGHLIPQVTDRRSPMPDIARVSVELPVIHSQEGEWDCTVKANHALLELRRAGGGPVHINLITRMSSDFSRQNLPMVRKIQRVNYNGCFPELQKGNVAVFVGAHTRWNDTLTKAVELFCRKYDAVVLCDHTSNYEGKYRVLGALVCRQRQYHANCCNPKTLIHIGDVSGAYMDNLSPESVWRVSPDGEIRDTFRKLTYVFEMDEEYFFAHYNAIVSDEAGMPYYDAWKNEDKKLRDKLLSLPFSNAWIAQKTLPKLPDGATIHFGILQSLRNWNYFEGPKGLKGYSNVGGFGIDGGVSSLIGASFADKNRLFYGVVGDLAFFYDMNSLGNRHVGNNIRLMIINNGIGAQFKVPGNLAYLSGFGDDANPFVAAEGHFGAKSRSLVKNYAENLGFTYLSAENKEEFNKAVDVFLDSENREHSILFEVFTDDDNERDAALIIENLEVSLKGKSVKVAKDILGQRGVTAVKNMLKKQ